MTRYRACLILIALLTGCTSTPPVVNIKPAGSTQFVQVAFGRAYFAPSESGEDHIVLLSDPIDDPTDASPGDPLTPEKSPPIWQLLSIQLHWRTLDSPKEDALVANNAVLHWYVYGKPTRAGMAVLHYVGTGSVALFTNTGGARVVISHAELKLADQHGQIRDPFHAFQVKCACDVQTDPQQVRQCMDDVASAIRRADHPELDASTQP